MRSLAAALVAVVVLALAAESAGASSIVQVLPPPRDTSAFTQAGITANEGPYGLGTYQWVVNRTATEAILVGYNQGDTDATPQVQINCSPTDPTGEIGRDITGIGYVDGSENKLMIADNSNNRILSFTRSNSGGGGDPVDCSNGEEITSVDGVSLTAPTGLAADSPGGLVFISATFDDGSGPAKGIIAFNPTAQTLVHWDYDYSGHDPGALAVDTNANGIGRVFAALNNGTIQASNVSLIDPAHDPAGNVIPPMSSGTPGNFISLSAEPNTERLWAMKADELDVFSMTTGTLLGTVSGISWGGQNLSVSAIDNDQQLAVTSSGATSATNLLAYPNPICTPGAALDVTIGTSVSFSPSCTDTDNSTVREIFVTNTQSRGSAKPNANDGITYTAANASIGQDDIAYRVQTQDGLSVEKHQLVNVTAAPPPPPGEQPVVRKTANLQLDSGDVFVKVPGSNSFVKLTADMLIPVGTIIDARNGKAHITLANADGSTYDGIFWDGIFQVTQGSGANPIATMKLRDDLVGAATTSAYLSGGTAGIASGFKAFIAKKKGKKKNGLWGDAHGKFTTSGKGGSAAVRGTRWFVGDYQCGALFKTARGKVLVNPVVGKNFFLKAGHQQFIYYKRCLR